MCYGAIVSTTAFLWPLIILDSKVEGSLSQTIFIIMAAIRWTIFVDLTAIISIEACFSLVSSLT